MRPTLQRGSINRGLAATAAGVALAGTLAVSSMGLDLIGRFEGLSLPAYLDPVGIPTICYGSTQGVRLGQLATFEECNLLLHRDTGKAGQAVARYIHVSVTQGQYDALVSFTYNLGAEYLRISQIRAKLNAGDCMGAAREFNAAPQIDRSTGRPRIWRGAPIKDRATGAVLLATGDTIKKWTTAKGRPLAGLIKRRAEEREMFEQGCPAFLAARGVS